MLSPGDEGEHQSTRGASPWPDTSRMMPHRGTVFYRRTTVPTAFSSLRIIALLPVPFCHRLHEPTRPCHAQASHRGHRGKGSPNPEEQAPKK